MAWPPGDETPSRTLDHWTPLLGLDDGMQHKALLWPEGDRPPGAHPAWPLTPMPAACRLLCSHQAPAVPRPHSSGSTGSDTARRHGRRRRTSCWPSSTGDWADARHGRMYGTAAPATVPGLNGRGGMHKKASVLNAEQQQ